MTTSVHNPSGRVLPDVPIGVQFSITPAAANAFFKQKSRRSVKDSKTESYANVVPSWEHVLAEFCDRIGIMRDFDSYEDYRHFATAVMRQSRYVLDEQMEKFLRTVVETGQSRKRRIRKGSFLWRAQGEHGLDYISENVEDPDSVRFAVPGPHSPERMKPLSGSAREGRVNPKGIPCLYLCDEKNTAMAETRPWLNSYVSLGLFRTTKEMVLMDLAKEQKYTSRHFYVDPTHFREPDPVVRESAVWGDIAHAFSEPVSPSDITAE